MPNVTLKDLEQNDLLKDLLQSEKYIVVNKADVQPRNDLHGYMQMIWEARRSFLMSNCREYPSVIIIHPGVEYKIIDSLIREKSTQVYMFDSFLSRRQKNRQLFDMRLIVSSDLEEDEIIIK